LLWQIFYGDFTQKRSLNLHRRAKVNAILAKQSALEKKLQEQEDQTKS